MKCGELSFLLAEGIVRVQETAALLAPEEKMIEFVAPLSHSIMIPQLTGPDTKPGGVPDPNCE